jgi:hypothetical protein
MSRFGLGPSALVIGIVAIMLPLFSSVPIEEHVSYRSRLSFSMLGSAGHGHQRDNVQGGSLHHLSSVGDRWYAAPGIDDIGSRSDFVGGADVFHRSFGDYTCEVQVGVPRQHVPYMHLWL